MGKKGKRSKAVIFTIIAAILSIAGLISYTGAESQWTAVYVLVILSLVLEAALIVLGKNTLANLVPLINAVLLAAAFILAVQTQVDYIGFVVSGLYSFTDILRYAVFAGCTFLAMIIYIGSSFADMVKAAA